MAFLWRVWLAIAVVNLTVLMLFVGLASLQYDAVHSSLVGERLAVLAARTAAPFEQAARIGLGLGSVRNADALLEQARQTDEAIAAIHVFDRDGRILRSTDRAPPATIPAQALAARAEAQGAPWHRAGGEAFLSGVEIAARSGADAGGVLIVYSAAQSTARVGAMATELILAGLLVLAGSMAAAAALLRFGLRRQIGAFQALEDSIDGFERAAWRTAAAAPPGASGGDLAPLLETTEQQYRAAGRALAATRQAS